MEPLQNVDDGLPALSDQATPTETTGLPSQWLDAVIRVRRELQFEVRQQANREVYVIDDPIRGKFYQIGHREFCFISQLDGSRKVSEAIELFNQSQSNPISETHAIQIVNWLVQSNLGFVPEADGLARLERQANALSRQRLLGVLNPISIKLKLFNPTKWLDKTSAASSWVFTKPFFAVWMVCGILGLYGLYSNCERLSSSSTGFLSEGRWIWLLGVWIVLKTIHEWGHGLACRRFGGEVPEAGVLLLLFTPMPFVNVTSSWRFRNRWHRFYVAAAGMYVEIFIAFVAMIVWANTSQPWLCDICFNIFFLSSVTTIMFNANPLMRFDGYYMLTDALDVPNLYPKGLKWFGDRLKAVLFGTPKTDSICPAHELPLVRVYGTLAFGWKILVSASLLIAASLLFHGLGILLALLGGALWIGMPVVRFFRSTFAAENANYVPSRVVFSSLIIVVIGVSLFTLLGSPAIKSAPALVQFESEQVLRAAGDGFVEEVLVFDGQSVSKGDRLVVLRNDDLETEVNNLKRELSESEIQARIYTKTNQLALAQTEREKGRSLKDRIKEKANQLEGLVLVAPFDGFVFERQLEHLKGQYRQHGSPIVAIARSSARKVVVSIDQEDLECVREGNESMKVVMPGRPVFHAKVETIDARATDRPIHREFAVSFGGPLPIETAPSTDPSDQEVAFRWLSPRIEIELEMDSKFGTELSCGQVGRAFFATKRQSLGAYLYLKTQKWIQRQVRQVTLARN